jgi:hypothetical protein
MELSSTNQKTSYQPAWKKRPFSCATLDRWDIFQQQKRAARWREKSKGLLVPTARLLRSNYLKTKDRRLACTTKTFDIQEIMKIKSILS